MNEHPGGTNRSAGAPLISEFAGDPDMQELVDLFVSELPERVAKLEASWNQRAMEEVRRIAHQLKGACGGYGFPVLGKVAGCLEQTVSAPGAAEDARVLETVRRQVEDLAGMCRRVRAR